MWWMTGKWRLDGRGWAIAFCLAALTMAVLALGALIPSTAGVTRALVGIIVVVALLLAGSSRIREFDQYDLGEPPDRDRGDGRED
jgi:uncharacterized membrane protein YccC